MHKKLEYAKPATFSTRSSRFIDREFQMKYTALVVGAAAVGMIVAVVPIYYFLDQNYKIFMDLAYEHSADLVSHLEREKTWIQSILMTSFTGVIVFFTLLGLRMTSQIVGPLKVLRNHLKLLSRGHWAQRSITIREQDEFQDLIESYNYFYASFRANLKKDLMHLKQISIDPSNRDAYRAWKRLIEEKAIQLNLLEDLPDPRPISVSDESDDPSHDSRHAS